MEDKKVKSEAEHIADIQADWNQTDSNHFAHIKNKPPITQADFDARYLKLTGGVMSGGINFGGSGVVSDPADLSKGIAFTPENEVSNPEDLTKGLYMYKGNDYLGFSITSKTLNYVAHNGDDKHVFRVGGGTAIAEINNAGIFIHGDNYITTPKIIIDSVEILGTPEIGDVLTAIDTTHATWKKTGKPIYLDNELPEEGGEPAQPPLMATGVTTYTAKLVLASPIIVAAGNPKDISVTFDGTPMEEDDGISWRSSSYTPIPKELEFSRITFGSNKIYLCFYNTSEVEQTFPAGLEFFVTRTRMVPNLESIPGEQGIKGETGDKGATGDKGEQGDKGVQGDKGETGDTGISANGTIGDVKNGFQTTDHNGWIKLDGRLISTLTTEQQANAATLGFITNLPDASNAVAIQNGGAMGAVNGSMGKPILQENLPNINLTSDNQGSHQHGMQACTNDGGTVGLSEMFERYPQTIWRRPSTVANVNNQNLIMIGYPMEYAGGHEHTIPTGGSGTALDITPKSISVNTFVFLG